MKRLAQLDMRDARYDRMREAVVVSAGADEIAITHSALENWYNRRLTPEEALEVAEDEGALLARVANTISAHDNIITITSGILNSRSWDLAPGDEE